MNAMNHRQAIPRIVLLALILMGCFWILGTGPQPKTSDLYQPRADDYTCECNDN